MNHASLQRPRLAQVAVAAGVAMLLAAPAVAQASPGHVQHAAAGDVSATFSYRGALPRYSDEVLTISRDGKVVYDHAVSHSACGPFDCQPGSESPNGAALHVVDLDGAGSDDVVLDLYTGGAHCCSIEQVYSYDAVKGTFTMAVRNFGDPGAVLEDLAHNGRDEFVSADDRFAYEFTDYAGSGMPLQIESFSAGRFHNVTRDYPKLIAQDAAVWMSAFKQQASTQYQDTTGVAAAWAADEDLLGQSTTVQRFLDRQAKLGHLNSALLGRKGSGTRFVHALERFLHETGYAS